MVTVVMVEKRPPNVGAEDRRRPARSLRPKSAPLTSLAAPAASDAGSGSATSQPSLPLAPAVGPLSANERFRRISVSAYFKAEQRGFEPGHMWEDWLAGEREVDAAMIAAMEPAQPK